VMGGEAWYCQFEHLCARICRTKGGGCAGGFCFANSSTCALEFAGPRVVDAQGDSVLPIRALAHLNLQNRGEMGGEARFCQFEHLRTRICRTEGSGWLGKGGDTWFCQFEYLHTRICRTRGSRWVGATGEAQFCQFEHLHTRICRTEGVVGWAKEGTPGFANSSTCTLKFAGPRVVGAQGDSVLQNRAQKCSNPQAQGGGEVGEARSEGGGLREVPVCRFEHASAQICKPGVASS